MNEPKKLYRCGKDKMVCGVCGGIARYFNVDPSLIRILTVLVCFAWGTGLIAYIIAACILPVNPYE
ncbi:MAG: PspC domain-containing protein [Thomasclavelia sp.]|jgi:phage shock protein C|nr:PspC domain-containing protein [Thomasclavelia sp.]